MPPPDKAQRSKFDQKFNRSRKNRLSSETAPVLLPHQRQADRSSGDDDPTPQKFLSGPDVCRRYAVRSMTIWRWLRDREINFPQPAMRIKDRRYWAEADLVAWERSRIPTRR
jgi:predicted DNA-binding transcriptional regulator AlpA